MTINRDRISVWLKGSRDAFHLDVALDLPCRGVSALFGPSGSGKTMTLRAIAGLERLHGHVLIGGEAWQDDAQGIFEPTHLRNLGYVFQEASLFPHLNVRDNLLYGARRVNMGRDLAGALARTTSVLGLAHLLERWPSSLSGGERQRVAIGRALMTGPRILLMDEPLAALDSDAKAEILPYLEAMHDSLDIPILYVSHDMREVERLVDTIVLIDSGRVLASGELTALATDPALPLFNSDEAAVVLAAEIVGFDASYGLTRLSCRGADLLVPGQHGAIGKTRRVRIAAKDVSLAKSRPTDSTILNCLPATIISLEDNPSQPQLNILIALGGEGDSARVVARITRKSCAQLGLAPGMPVFAQIKGVALVASAAATGIRPTAIRGDKT